MTFAWDKEIMIRTETEYQEALRRLDQDGQAAEEKQVGLPAGRTNGVSLDLPPTHL